MKMTKRILALVTAFVLCLAPMALMVGAAETLNEIHFTSRRLLCNHHPDNFTYTGGDYDSEVTDDYVYHWYYCKRIWYRNGTATCNICGNSDTVDYSVLIAHPTFIQGSDGIMRCPDCGMEKQN